MSSASQSESKDISMVDVSTALNEVDSKSSDAANKNTDEEIHSPPLRRKSTLILTDEDMGLTQGSNNDNGDQMQIDQSQVDLSQSSSGHGQPPTNQDPQQQEQVQPQQTSEAHEQAQNNSSEQDLNITVPIEIKWTQGGEKVYVTGSFTGWRKMIGLARQPDSSFLITLGLPVGTHRFRFVVDNELRFSDYLPTATDQMGNFVNYVEVTPDNVREFIDQQEQSEEERSESEIQANDTSEVSSPPPPSTAEPSQAMPSRKSSISRSTRSDSMWGLTNDDDDMGNGYFRYHDEEGDTGANKKYQFITDIPPIFIDPQVMEQYYIAIEKQSKSQNGQQAWLHPPQLPPHLESVILNNFNSMDRDNNSGALPIPNHVVLNHLATTSIKHNTLSVASIVRYKRKYVTQVLYAPLSQ